MNDVEKKFSESLRHHEVSPPPAVWNQLSANLAQQRRRKAVVYWRVAAAVALLLLGVGTLITLLRSEPAGQKLVQQQPPASNPEELTGAPADSNRTEGANFSQKAAPSSDASESSPALAGSVPLAKQDRDAPKTPDLRSISAEPARDRLTQLPSAGSVTQPKHPTVATLPPMAFEAVKLVPTVAVRQVLPPTVPQPNGLAPTTLASSDPPPTATGVQRRTITVIYKPGSRSSQPPAPNQNDGLLSKTLSFLEDVKKNGPTYSELRSAKSALLDNVFSRDPAKQK
ncbi:MAG: hypothetical protein WA958_12315 [Tunicatimonas sp.]